MNNKKNNLEDITRRGFMQKAVGIAGALAIPVVTAGSMLTEGCICADYPYAFPLYIQRDEPRSTEETEAFHQTLQEIYTNKTRIDSNNVYDFLVFFNDFIQSYDRDVVLARAFEEGLKKTMLYIPKTPKEFMEIRNNGICNNGDSRHGFYNTFRDTFLITPGLLFKMFSRVLTHEFGHAVKDHYNGDKTQFFATMMETYLTLMIFEYDQIVGAYLINDIGVVPRSERNLMENDFYQPFNLWKLGQHSTWEQGVRDFLSLGVGTLSDTVIELHQLTEGNLLSRERILQIAGSFGESLNLNFEKFPANERAWLAEMVIINAHYDAVQDEFREFYCPSVFDLAVSTLEQEGVHEWQRIILTNMQSRAEELC